jgi:hypothetical protein
VIRDWLKPKEMAELCGWSVNTLKRRSASWRHGREWRWATVGTRRERQFHRARVIEKINR